MIKYMKTFGLEVCNDVFAEANYGVITEKQYVRRVNGKRYGKWEVKVEDII